MKLYFSPGACSLAPHIVARELGLSSTSRRSISPPRRPTAAMTTSRSTRRATSRAAARRRHVLTEASAILQYLADRNPRPSAPAYGTIERYRVARVARFHRHRDPQGLTARCGTPTARAYKAIAVANLAKRFAIVESQLGKRLPDRRAFTIADAYAFVIINWADYLKVDLAPYTKLRAFLARVAARPGVQAAMRAEGLIKEPAVA